MLPLRFIRALIVLHRTFGSLPLKARLHTLVRFLTAPLLRVAREVPAGALLLDLGAGHGVFARLALDAGARRVIAVEPDIRKLFGPLAGIDFVAGYDACMRGSFDAVAIVDVLYKIPVAEWDALFARVAARLKPGGLLIVKEQDPTARVKNAWNGAQERLVSLAGLTLGESFSYEAPRDFTERLERAGFTDVQTRRIDFLYPHPHVLYTCKFIPSAARDLAGIAPRDE
jgi:SAM-dependent methyltransferase